MATGLPWGTVATFIRWDIGGDYLLLVFTISLGVLQLVSAWGRLEGLSFFSRRYLGYIFAAVVIGAGYCWFFFRGIERNIPDYEGGLAGGQLLYYTIAGIAIAFLLTILVSSALKARWGRSHPEDSGEGLEALRRMTYLQAIRRGLKRNGQ